MELFKLFGSILIDNKEANDSLSKTEQKAEGVFSKLGSGVATVAKVGAAIGGMAIAGGAALLGVANKSAEVTDRIDKLSLKTQLSRQGFQEWDHVMSQSGMSIESLQGGMKKLVNSIDDALQGNATYTESFNRLGISMEDLQGKSPEEAFEMTVAALQEMPQSAEKAALANELLGRSASEMAPILDMSAEATNALKQEAHDLGLIMSDEAVDAGVLFGDTMANVKDSFGMLVSNIGVMVMPMIQSFLDWVLANMPTIQAVMETVFKAIGEFVRVAVDVFQTYFLPAIISVVDWVVANWPTIQTVIETVINAVRDIISTVTSSIKAIWDKWGNDILYGLEIAWNAIKNIVETTIGVIRGIIQTVTSLIKGDWSGVWEGIKAIFSSVWDGIKNHVDLVINAIKGVISNVTDSIKTTWSNVWNGIKDTTTNIWNGIKSAIMTPIEWVRDKVKGVIDTIKGFFNFKISWPHIPTPSFGISPPGWKIGDLLKGSIPRLSINWNAEGGIFDTPTIFNTHRGLQGVGEAGPEVIQPLSHLQSLLDMNRDRDLYLEMVSLLKQIRDKNSSLFLDSDKLVGYILDQIDERLAERQAVQELATGGA